MRELLGPFAASLRDFRKRRASLVLLIVAPLIMSITAFGSYQRLEGRREEVRQASAGDVEESALMCFFDECRFRRPGGEIFGSPFPRADLHGSERQRLLEAARAEVVRALAAEVRALETEFAPRRLFASRTRTAGTFWGVLFAIWFAAAIFGGEWRWSLWRTQLVQEPRRGRLLVAKLTSLWILVAVGFVVALGFVAAADAVFRVIFSVEASGGAGFGTLAGDAARSLIGIEAYATLAASLAVVVRGSLGGFGAPLLLILVDGLVTQRYVWLHRVLPGQQIAWLVRSIPSEIVVSTMWWEPTRSKTVCVAGGCRHVPLPPVGRPVAAAVLVAWIGLATLWAYAALRSRDIPQ